MINVRKAIGSDFESVYPLLLLFNNQRFSKDDWNKLFLNHWDANDDFHGFILVDDNKTVGYLGAITSKRLISDIEINFCNVNTWVVLPEYRNHSLTLLYSMLSLKNFTFTNFTPTEDGVKMFELLGFKVLENNIRLIPINPLSIFCSKINIIFDINEIQKKLFDNEQKIVDDHIKFNGKFALIESNNEHCLVIFSILKRKKMPFAQIQYLSNPAVFFKNYSHNTFKLCLKYKLLGVLIDNRFTENYHIKSFSVRKPVPSLFKSNQLSKYQIDTLYSEMFVNDNMSV